MTAAFRVNELLNWQVAGAAEPGEIAVADASASKVFASDEVQAARAGAGARIVHGVRRPGGPGDRRG